jgi:uncharacterized protein with ATP-grasp and redox domains
MKLTPDCYPCIIRQAAAVVQSAGVEPDIQFRALNEVLLALSSADPQLSPSAIAGETNRVIREITGIDDFYLEEKKASHNLALSYLAEIRSLLHRSTDPLTEALKISAAGNIIDVVHPREYDLWEEVISSIKGDLQGRGLAPFKERLTSAEAILYLADNVGETIFDRVLIENLPHPVIYAVKSGPILNDATREDAIAAGIDQVAEIIENGTQSPGTVLSQTSAEFREAFDQADLIISKGQANFETVDEQGDKIFFLMRVKCHLISERVGAPVGSLLLKQGRPQSNQL